MSQVKIVTTEVTPFTVETSAQTWGELKAQIADKVPNVNNMTVVLSTTKNTLDLDSAQLPSDESYKIFMSPKNIKQGAVSVAAVLARLSEMFSDAVNDLIEEIEDGDFGDDDTSDGDDDLAMLRQIKNQLG